MSILETLMTTIYKANVPTSKSTAEGPSGLPSDPAKLARLKLLAQLTPDNNTTVRGEVMDLRQNQILLKLLSGEQLDARTASPLPLSIGDVADFIVTSNDGQIVTLKLANPEGNSSEATKDQLASNALRAANIQINERSLTVVRELLNHSQAVSAANIRKYMGLSARYPEADVKNLLLMDINGIEISDSNVQLFSEFNKQAAQVLPELNKAYDELSQMIRELPEGDGRESLQTELNSIISEAFSDSPESADAALSTAPEVTETAQEPIHMPTEEFSSNYTNEPNNNAAHAEVIPPHLDTAEVISNPSVTAEAAPVQNDNTPASLPAEKPRMSDAAESAPKSDSDYSKSEVEKAAVPPREFSQIAVKKFYSRLKDVSGKLDKLMEKIREQQQADTISKGIEKAGESSENRQFSHTGNLNSTLKFMDAVNDVFPYIQLPVKLKEENAHGELYVYEKKKVLRDSETLSALLHLELDNLGPTDIYVKLSGSNVYTSFSVSDEKAEKIFADELPSLNEALAKRGYSLSSDIKLRSPEEEKPPLLTEFLEARSPSSVTRYSFDMRA